MGNRSEMMGNDGNGHRGDLLHCTAPAAATRCTMHCLSAAQSKTHSLSTPSYVSAKERTVDRILRGRGLRHATAVNACAAVASPCTGASTMTVFSPTRCSTGSVLVLDPGGLKGWDGLWPGWRRPVRSLCRTLAVLFAHTQSRSGGGTSAGFFFFFFFLFPFSF